MKKLAVTLNNIQHLERLHFEADLSSPRLICITGKNGAGKTTLVKALRTLANADTFPKTTAASAFSKKSSICYRVDDLRINFHYNERLGSIDTTDFISDEVRDGVIAELPLPHGERFNFFQRISGADDDIRRAIAVDDFHDPAGLKNFLRKIYQSQKFDNLIEIRVKGIPYYCILLDGLRYIREDYLSSGEYFVIALYRRIVSSQALLVIDEIDISLDAAAQVRLVDCLRELSKLHGVSIIFTTHSIALMRSLEPEELFYIDEAGADGMHAPSNLSFNHINSLLFGFKGWDKYILTEDDMLGDFLEHLIAESKAQLFYKYKIIHIGGAKNTVDLMQRNKTESFFADARDVITVIDGDQRAFRHARALNVHLLPFESIEKAFLSACIRGQIAVPVEDHLPSATAARKYIQALDGVATGQGGWLERVLIKIRRLFRHEVEKPLKERQFSDLAKSFYKQITKDKRVMGQKQVFQRLCELHATELLLLRRALDEFLCGRPIRNSQDRGASAANAASTEVDGVSAS